jgi:hypothetical protein
VFINWGELQRLASTWGSLEPGSSPAAGVVNVGDREDVVARLGEGGLRVSGQWPCTLVRNPEWDLAVALLDVVCPGVLGFNRSHSPPRRRPCHKGYVTLGPL